MGVLMCTYVHKNNPPEGDNGNGNDNDNDEECGNGYIFGAVVGKHLHGGGCAVYVQEVSYAKFRERDGYFSCVCGLCGRMFVCDYGVFDVSHVGKNGNECSECDVARVAFFGVVCGGLPVFRRKSYAAKSGGVHIRRIGLGGVDDGCERRHGALNVLPWSVERQQEDKKNTKIK